MHNSVDGKITSRYRLTSLRAIATYHKKGLPRSFGSPAIPARHHLVPGLWALLPSRCGKVAFIGISSLAPTVNVRSRRTRHRQPTKRKPATNSRLHHWLLAAQVPKLERRLSASTRMANRVPLLLTTLLLYITIGEKASPFPASLVKVGLRDRKGYDIGSFSVSRGYLRRSKR